MHACTHRTLYLSCAKDVCCAARATAKVYGREVQLSVRTSQTSQGRRPMFVVSWEGGRECVGSTPTAPFAKLARFVGSLDVANGIKVAGA